MGSPKPTDLPTIAGEDDLLQLIRATLGNGIESFDLRDDAAVVEVAEGGSVVVSVDSVVEGVHVDLSLCSPTDVGWKALMGAVSDLAAMGALPIGALIALCVPGGSGNGEVALGVTKGVAEASAAALCPVVGGDVSSAGQVVVAVTVLGSVASGRPAVTRAGAAPGDAILVTGPCGGSAAGLRQLRARTGLGEAYRRPVARLREGEHGEAGGGNGHDRRLRRPGARPAPSGRRLRRGLRAGRRPGGRRGDLGGGLERRRGLRVAAHRAAVGPGRLSKPRSQPRDCARRCVSGSSWPIRRFARCEVRRWPGWAGSTRWADDQLLALGW